MNLKKTILIVDDHREILKILRIKLRVLGYDVLTAPGGEEALVLLETVIPDIMLLDVIMPGMDGFEVLEKVRAFSTFPVIVYSARPENADKALSMGANDFLTKPFDPDDLIKRIKKQLILK
jgi:DNA-binding response OmpR family regulator